jgi:hypothetical protein
MKGPAIRLHIEELVLHSFDPHDRYAIADAFQQELSRLLGEQLVNPEFSSAAPLMQHSSNSRLDGGAFHAEQHAKPNFLGNQIAGAVHRGLTK